MFEAIVRNEIKLIEQMIKADANPNSIYELSKGNFVSSFNLLVLKTAELAKKKGSENH